MKPVVFHSQHPVVVVVTSLVMSACGISAGTDPTSSSEGVQGLAWSPTGTNPIDSGSGLVIEPLVVREPDGGGTALAVWVEQTDLNPFDSLPAIHHLYARRFSAAGWAGDDTGCPAGSGADDGICLMDHAGAEFGAWLPQVSMDNNGDAIVVWQQADGTDCDSLIPGTQNCANIYARRFHVGAGACGSLCWESAEAIDTANTPAVNPSLAMGGGTALVVWEQWDGTDWSIYARRFTGGVAAGSWTNSDVATGCTAGAGENGADDGVCGIDALIAGSAHQPRVRMTNAGDAFASFIQFVAATCYTATISRTTPVSPFSCPHNRLYYRTYPSGGVWTAATDFTPGTSLPSASGCFDFLSSTGGENMDCSCGGWGCDCNTINTPINTNTCRTFSNFRLDMDRVATTSATVVYKSVENALVPDISGDCDCGCGGWGCDCDCETFDPAGGTDTYQRIRIDAFGLAAGVTTTPASPLADFSYFGSSGSPNCPSTNPSDGDDYRRILNCDLDSPTVAVEPDGGGARFAVWEQYNGSIYDIVARRFSGSWAAAATLDTLPTDAHAPQVVTDDAGNALGVFIQRVGSGKWRIYSRRNIGGTWVTTDAAAGCAAGGLNGADDGVCNVDGNLDDKDAYFYPVVSMDGPGSALGLFIGFLNSNGSTRLYGVTGP
jgi:hypothetical protein